MPQPPAASGSARSAAAWNQLIREFMRTRHGRSLSSVERAEYERLRDAYTRALRDELESAA